MFEAIKALAERSVIERIVLLTNHVISAEPQAAARLRTHASRAICFELEGWPALLPQPGPLSFRITPAGLVEWIEEAVPSDPDLRVTIEAPNPALALARLVVGERPAIRVEGDAAFAADVNWLIENLRWDVQDDLARIVGNAPARELSRFASAVAKALREGAKTLGGLVDGGAWRGKRPASEPPPR
jgi:ubiquinone biosynthesis protein UbiJ